METLRRRFLALGDETRLRALLLILSAGELCLCHLEQLLELPASTASRHLGLLREAGLVSARRAGRWVHFGPGTGEARAWLDWLVQLPELAAERERAVQTLAQWRNDTGGTACPI